MSLDSIKCNVCGKIAIYNCIKCGGDFCKYHVDNHSEIGS